MKFVFRNLKIPETTPHEWLTHWAGQYEQENSDEKKYRTLISKYSQYCEEDFRQIGMWKDGVTEQARATRWKENVASVAFLIWERVAAERPERPALDERSLREFLKNWSTRTYSDTFRNGVSRTKQFGLSRATTLLHFLSGGVYPIFDARVRVAIGRLKGTREINYSLDAYFGECLPACRELVSLCETKDIRNLDKALFSYGALSPKVFKNASS